ncbi:MAG: hypothetical protein QOF41_681 [Methylobacteriaceae bacterium]|nr:hypothetical protein [Methylobacteriaceae bacterium]
MDRYDPVVMRAIEGLSEKEAYDKIQADDELHGLARMARFDPVRKAEEAAALRKLMTRLGAVAYCELRFCQRAGECVHPKARCFWQNLTMIQKLVFPVLWRKVEEMEAAGVEFNFPPAARPTQRRT